MPALRKTKREAFARHLAAGKIVSDAYIAAGYSVDGKGWERNAHGLKRAPDIAARMAEILEHKAVMDIRSTERAIERMAISKEAVGREFALTGFANMMDFTRLDADGHRVLDLSNVTRDQMAAVSEMAVDYYVEGTGEEALRVKKVRVKLHPKHSALVGLSRLFGWIVDGRGASDDEVRRIADRLNQMTDEQRLEDAKQLAARIRETLDMNRQRTIEGEARDVTDEAVDEP